jgi:hypothetical protein
MVAFLAVTAQGDLNSSATADVHVKVVPNVSVTPVAPIVDAGSIQSGDLTVPIVFNVHANTEAVRLWVAVSQLYKGDQPVNPTVNPIPVKLSAGATIAPQGASVLGGGSNVAGLPSLPNTTIGAFPAYLSNTIDFESMDNGSFSHPVTVTIVWTLSDPQQPQGDYSGEVQLFAMVLPSS